jgi:hypothetical protein
VRCAGEVVVRWWWCRSSLPSVSLEIFSGAVVEERALKHGPRNESPIPAGPPPDSDGMSLALYSACTITVSSSLLGIYVHCLMLFTLRVVYQQLD